ncbi:MAG: cob(I)yrinic acid a,c-diamide adenosyltransferase [Lachnospiraceae bacterium]|nr:cob(I)yrinic acid a,c-diamide adenosyltransferase [Lachnospiraceae bacterium]
MKKGHIYTYYGCGKGKTTLAIGQGMRVLGNENTVVMLQFLNQNESKEFLILNKLEPDFRVFEYGTLPEGVSKLTEEQEADVTNDIKMGFGFANKIIETGESDMLILDGILDAVSKGYLCEDTLCETLSKKESYMDIILTGNDYNEKIAELSDFVYSIKTEKFTEAE